MPPNEPCPSCKEQIPDWHREWHTREDQAKLFHGTAGMECPMCGATVCHAQWGTPLQAVAADAGVDPIKRNVDRAAIWAHTNGGMTLEAYLMTDEGKPYSDMWTAHEVQHADVLAANNPSP